MMRGRQPLKDRLSAMRFDFNQETLQPRLF